MSDEDKKAFDAKMEDEAIIAKAFEAADRMKTGYENMDYDTKIVYDKEFLEWFK